MSSSRLRQSLSASVLILFLCSSQQIFAGKAELQPLPPNSVAEGFTLPDLTGKSHALSDYRGKVVLVNFWASWCPPCIYEMPVMARLKKQLQNQPFEVLAVNVGEKKYRVRKFVKLINLELPVLLDTSKHSFAAWGIKTLPTSLLIDAEGNMRYLAYGDPGWDDENTISVIEQLISEHTATNKHNKIKSLNEANR